jgi:ligand-binding sensor domain-containing protein/serine phosphatase RsbU (regulator of sigma subunit)
VNTFDPKTKTFKRYQNIPGDPFSISDNKIASIFEDREGNLWIGTLGGGLNKFDQRTGKFKSYRHIPGNSKSLSNNRINSIIEDKDGNLLIGTWGGGLNIFDRKTETFASFLNKENDDTSLPSNTIYKIYIDKSDRIWIGTENGGLSLFDYSSKTFFTYKHNEGDERSLSNNSVSAVFEDKSGTLWVGVHRGGINYYNPNQEKFAYYTHEFFRNSVSNKNIRSFCEDKDGNIWIGTDGGGLNKFDRKTKAFTSFKHNIKDPNSISSDVVLSIEEDESGNLWIGTWGGGLNYFDKKSGKFFSYKNDPNDPTSLSSNDIWCIKKIDETLWLGTWSGGLNILDLKSNKNSRIPCGVSTEKSTSCWIADIKMNSKGEIWIATTFGLYLTNPEAKTFKSFFHSDTIPGSLTNNTITSIFEDSKGNMWFGAQAGLNKYIPSNQSFKKFTQQHGLPSAAIASITEDKTGNLWLGTLGGLCKFNPETEKIQTYTESDGLQGNEFSQNASLKTKDGEMYFGGINGFNVFRPENVKANDFIPPVLITGFQIFNKDVPVSKNSVLKAHINEVKEITLSYKESVFSFEFAALNYILPENNQYLYKMEGFDKDWGSAKNSRRATYTNLDPGEYIFKVKGSNNDGIWNSIPTEIKISITPPFWRTWWFRVSMILLAIGLIALWYRRRTAAMREQQELLEKEVRERTAEVVEQKEKIQLQSEKLEDLYLDIKDSIRAAEVIQQSLLPSQEKIKKYFQHSFILNKPKDVVSGDFYWFDVIGDKIIIAAADCTGHGVSGAFMSINGHHLLNKTIHTLQDIQASEILNKMNEEMISELNYEDKSIDTQNGMDMSVCVIDKTKNLLQYAGADSQIYILRNKEILQIKGNKFPIGLTISGHVQRFNNHKIELQKGDTIYMFSDGFADQIGGSKGEKLMYFRFRELLLQCSNEAFSTQCKILDTSIEHWKGNHQQTDDILVMGFKID